jgi:hypothetical protein
MRDTSSLLCAVPPKWWTGKSGPPAAAHLAAVLRDAVVIERRIATGINADDERRRYQAIVQRAQDIALDFAEHATTQLQFRNSVAAGALPAIRLGASYTDLLSDILRRGQALGCHRTGRIGAALIPPGELRNHEREFNALAAAMHRGEDVAVVSRRRFLEWATGCGLIEIVDAGGARTSASNSVDGAPTSAAEGTAARDDGDWQRYRPDTGNHHEFMRTRLREQIRAAIASDEVVNMSNQRHNLATEILNEFIHQDANEPPTDVRIVYGDGSEAARFPLRCVDRLPHDWRPHTELHIAMISMRHLPLDRHIHLNWFRNVEVPNDRGLAHADETCFRTSLAQFDRLAELYRNRRLRLFVYHTGYPPAVIAFYRAFVSTVRTSSDRDLWLQAVPMLQPRRDNEVEYDRGQRWPRTLDG